MHSYKLVQCLCAQLLRAQRGFPVDKSRVVWDFDLGVVENSLYDGWRRRRRYRHATMHGLLRLPYQRCSRCRCFCNVCCDIGQFLDKLQTETSVEENYRTLGLWVDMHHDAFDTCWSLNWLVCFDCFSDARYPNLARADVGRSGTSIIEERNLNQT